MRLPIELSAIGLTALVACGGGGGSPAAGAPLEGGLPDNAPVCDQSCMDGIALRALRDAIKVVFNTTLQGKPVGPQDQTTPCLPHGSAHVYGQATSNANQGTTSVDLTYVLTGCMYFETSDDPIQTFSLTLTGTVTESGTIAVEPSTTTALQFQSSAMTFSGAVGSPPVIYDASVCAVVLEQMGSNLSGTVCGRRAGVTL